MRTVLLLFMLLTIPLSTQALTLEDLTSPGAQFTAGPLVFRNFAATFVDRIGDPGISPVNLESIPVVPLDVGGFTLATTFSATGIGSRGILGFNMTFTAETTGFAPIIGLTSSVQDMGAFGFDAFASLEIGGTAFLVQTFPPDNAPDILGSASMHRQLSPTNTLDTSLSTSLHAGAACSPEVPFSCAGSVSFRNPTVTFQVAQVPEPSVFWLFGLVAVGLGGLAAAPATSSRLQLLLFDCGKRAVGRRQRAPTDRHHFRS